MFMLAQNQRSVVGCGGNDASVHPARRPPSPGLNGYFPFSCCPSPGCGLLVDLLLRLHLLMLLHLVPILIPLCPFPFTNLRLHLLLNDRRPTSNATTRGTRRSVPGATPATRPPAISSESAFAGPSASGSGIRRCPPSPRRGTSESCRRSSESLPRM